MSKDATPQPDTDTDFTLDEWFELIRAGIIGLRPLVNLEDESPIDAIERGAI